MNILLVHNFYQQPGGEDQVFADEASMLRAHGDRVETFTVHNSAVDKTSRASVAAKTIWNRQSVAAIRDAATSMQAQVVHFHNTFPLISPAAYKAAGDAGAAVVQTLHNYRLLCPSATLYRDGHVCEDCVGKLIAWPAVQHACYRGSRAGSAAVATMLTVHKTLGTWQNDVDAYIALTDFARNKMIEGGLPEDRLFVKPNFIDPDPGAGDGKGDALGRFAIFVGRLTHEKGVATVLDAWKQVGGQLPLKILGDGPLREAVIAAASNNSAIEYLGRRPMTEVLQLIGQASMLVFPSVWYEGLPRTIVESFAKATPVVASRLGSMSELINSGKNGLLFAPGDAADLARTVLTDQFPAMRAGTRQTFQEKYTATPNYQMLQSIYQHAIRTCMRRKGGCADRNEATRAFNGRPQPASSPLVAGSHS